VSNALIVLLPPSEAKAFGGERGRTNGGFDSALRRPRREIVKAFEDFVQHAPQTTLERTLNVRGPLLKRAVSAARQVGAHRAPLLPAWQRYSGVVWTHLDPSTLVSEELSRIIVPSGLYGMTTGEDLVADYRLRMNVRLPGVGNVASFWRPRLVSVLSSCLMGATFVNLLPKEHVARWTSTPSQRSVKSSPCRSHIEAVSPPLDTTLRQSRAFSRVVSSERGPVSLSRLPGSSGGCRTVATASRSLVRSRYNDRRPNVE